MQVTKKLPKLFVCDSCYFYFSTDVVYKLEYIYDAPLLSWTAKKVSKEALSTASSSTTVEYPHSKQLLSKNAKLASLRQSHFIHDKTCSTFGFADVLTHSSGDVLI